jgi:HAD superfamily hydrolase (TIGR01484 family)
MIKAIFFDIDGTLVTNRSKALESTKQAIEYARKNGILCGVATGRSPVKIKEIIDELELDMYVVYNGQLVFTADRTIIDHPFEQKVLEHIVEFADENHRQIVFWCEKSVRWINDDAIRTIDFYQATSQLFTA